MISDLFIVGVSGFFGSIARYGVYLWFGQREPGTFPWPTLTVNLIGCFVIGIFGVLIERKIPQYQSLYLIGSVGFIGTFTTFSAFGFDTLNLLREQEPMLAAANVAGNVVLGVAAVLLGRALVGIMP